MAQGLTPSTPGEPLPPEFRQVVEEVVFKHYPTPDEMSAPQVRIEGEVEVSRGEAQRVVESDTSAQLDAGLERAKVLQVVELHIDPETSEGQRMIDQLGILHDECSIPKSALRSFRAGGDRALRKAFTHGGMPDEFHPEPNAGAIYKEYQRFYLSPREALIHQLLPERPGKFHVLALVDSRKDPNTELSEYLQGYITFRLPPFIEEGEDVIMEYRDAIAELIALNPSSQPGEWLPGDMTYVKEWDMAHMYERLGKTMELDTIIVKRGNRRCGGAFILIDELIKKVQQERGDAVTKMVCMVFDGFTDKYSVQDIDDEDEEDPNLPSVQAKPVGKNIGSSDFFERDLNFTSFATRRTPSEVIVRDVSETAIPDLAVFDPHWRYFYNSFKRIIKQLNQSEILQKLGRR